MATRPPPLVATTADDINQKVVVVSSAYETSKLSEPEDGNEQETMVEEMSKSGTASANAAATDDDVKNSRPETVNADRGPVEEESKPSTDDSTATTATTAPAEPGVGAEEGEDENAAECRKLLEEARKDLADAPADLDDTELAVRILAVASCQGDYLISVNSKDEGAFTEALELAAKAEGLASPNNNLTHGRTMFTQMQICYSMYAALKNPEWLHQGVKIGEASAKTLSDYELDWLTIMEPWMYRQYYSNRCERVAYGYKQLFEAEDSADAIRLAVTWQGSATDATEPTDGPEGSEPWQKKYARFHEWLRLWVRNMDKNPNWQLAGPIELAVDLYPHDLREGPEMRKACNFQIINLRCRHWAITGDETILDIVIDMAKDLMVYNRDTEKISTMISGQWCDDPDNRQHALRVAALFFTYYYSMDEDDSQWYNHLASIQTLILLWEEWRKGNPRLTLANLEEGFDPLIRLQDLYARKYALKKVAADGWRYDDLNFENCRASVSVSAIRGGNDDKKVESPEVLLSEALKGAKTSTIGTSIVTREDFTIWQEGDDITFDLNEVRLHFKTNIGEGVRPPRVEDWISGRTDDGHWVLGGAVEGRDDDVLEYIRNYNSDSKNSGDKKEIEASKLEGIDKQTENDGGEAKGDGKVEAALT